MRPSTTIAAALSWYSAEMPRIRIAPSEQGVDEGGDGGALGENHEAPEYRHQNQQGQQPEFLAHAHEVPKLPQELHRPLSEQAFHAVGRRARRCADDPCRVTAPRRIDAQRIS